MDGYADGTQDLVEADDVGVHGLVVEKSAVVREVDVLLQAQRFEGRPFALADLHPVGLRTGLPQRLVL